MADDNAGDTLLGGSDNGGDNPGTGGGDSGGTGADATGTGDQGNGATGTGNWLDAMPEELKTHPSMEKFAGESPEILAKSYINLEKMVGRDKIPMPQTPDEYKSAFQRLGAPATADGYEFKIPDNLPAGLEFDKASVEGFSKIANELNLTQEQASGLYKQMWDTNISNFEATQESRIASQELVVNELKNDWGENDFSLNMEVANRALESVFSEQSQALIKERLGDSPDIIKDLNKLGANLMEEGALTGINTGGGLTPKMMDDKIGELMAHPAYMDAAHIEHKKIVDQVYMLRQRKFKT